MSTYLDDARIVYHSKFDGNGFTNENSLANHLLTRPDEIDPVLTHLLGREDQRFPLSFLTEGQYGGSVEVSDVEYYWNVINKLRKVDYVISSTYGVGDKPGLNYQPFYVTMKSNWLKKSHLVESEGGAKAQVVDDPVSNGLYWVYTMQAWSSDPGYFIPLSEVAAGSKWGMVGGAPVTQSRSSGNSSNVVTPGKIKNQLSLLRKSYAFGGNIANRTVEFKFNLGNGASDSLWMNWEQWQHMIQWKEAIEEHCWYSEYNRDDQGVVHQKDPANGEPIYTGAGLLDQISNRDTFAELTTRKLKNIVRDVLFGSTDGKQRNIVLYTGTGGRDEFDQAMKAEAAALSFNQVQGDKFIRGTGSNLILGGYFATYEHVDGHTITIKHLPLLDDGGRALVSRKHPISRLPLTSHHMYFVDQSIYDGKRNLTMVHQKGRSMVTGIVRGMTPLPSSMSWAGNNTNINLATDVDMAETHFMASKGIMLKRNTHCFRLECTLA